MTFELKLFNEFAEQSGVTVTDRPNQEHPGGSTELISKLKKNFLRLYEQCGLLEEAAVSAGITTSMVLDWRTEDEDFKKKYDDKQDSFVTLLEDAAMKRALSGKDSLMLMFLLKANRPDKYDDKARTPAQNPGIIVSIVDVGGNQLTGGSASNKVLPVEGEILDGEIQNKTS